MDQGHNAESISVEKIQELQENEKKYRNIFQYSPLGIFHYDQETIITDCNDKFVEIIGSSYETLVGLNMRQHIKDAKILREVQRSLTQGFGFYNDTYQSITADKSTPVRIIFRGIIGDDGSIIGGTGLVEDISKRKSAEQALAENERKLRILLGNLPGMAYRCRNEPDWPMEFVSKGVTALTGYEPSELISGDQPYGDCIHPEDQQAVWENVQQALAEQRPFEIEYRILTKDGELRWVWERGMAVSEEAIAPRAIEGFIIDATDRKQAEAALRKSEQNFRELFNSISDLVYTQDLQGRFLSVNPALNQLFGYAPHEFIGKTAADFMPERYQELFESEYLDTLKQQGRYEGVSSYFRKDGTKIYIEYKSELVYPDNGKPYISGIGRDVTERILAEKARKQLESQLSQAQKMEAIGQLAGGVAHDLNNLLSPILGYGEILQRSPKLDDDSRKQLEHILQAGLRARDLVSQLLAFSRKQTLEFKPVNLNSILVLFEKLLRRTIREDIELTISLAEDLGTVQADVGQLEQVVMNLAVNAQDAMPAGGTLSIQTRSVTFNPSYAPRHSDINPGRYAMLEISDTGEGMSQDILDKIYDPFFTTKETGKGTGLGLSTVYGIIKQHGGHIRVNSELNQGTAFTISFPICEDPQEKGTAPSAPRLLKGTETIVVAEDNHQVLQLVLTILELQGYTVLCAESGAQALSILEQHERSVSLLLTDVIMPDMNGKELYEQASQRFPGIKVLYMSGYTEDVIGHHGVLEKDTLYIQKPFTVAGLAQKVREVLDGGEEEVPKVS